MTGWFLGGIFLFFLLWMIYIYNRLVTLRNEVSNSWHQIDVQLKRRHDLIPNLVSVVKGYMEFERDTLEKVTSARAKALSATRIPEKAVSEDMLTLALGKLFAVIENYPVLKSNENVLHLQEELSSTENRISFARQLYNDLVANYRTRLEVFPDTVIARMFSFKGAEYFSADAADRMLPRAVIGIQKR
jgi:LemA protein